MATIEDLRSSGEIGGLTVQIVESGAVECTSYDPAPLTPGSVRIATVKSAISPGTEMTFYGKDASNVYLHKTWNADLRVFEKGAPSLEYPVAFGYRAAGEVVDAGTTDVPVGTRVFGSWRHTELTSMPAERARQQMLPHELSWNDGVDLGQMGPICVNAVAFAEGEHVGAQSVVFGAGPVGLITAQVARADGSDVVVVDRIEERVGIARDLGFETIASADGRDIAVELKQRFGSEALPVAWECSGSTFALNEAIRVVRRQGLVVAVGFYQGEARGLVLGDEFHHNGIRIVCGQIGNIHRSMTMDSLRERTMQLATTGSIHLGSLPRLTVPVQRVADAFDALRRPAEVLQTELVYPTYA